MASLLSWFRDRKKDVGDIASRVYDQVNPLDNGLTYQNRQGNVSPQQQPRSAAQQLFHSGASNVVGGAVKPVIRGVNTAATLIPLTAQLAGAARESITGTDNSYKQLMQDYAKSRQELFSPRAGAFYQGTYFKSPQEAADISATDLTKKIGGAGLEIGATVAPIARGTTLLRAGMGAKQAIPRLAAEGAVYGAGGSSGAQLAENGRIDPKQLAQDTAISTALGPLTYGIGRGLKATRTLPENLQSDVANVKQGLQQFGKAIEDYSADRPLQQSAPLTSPPSIRQTVNTANRVVPDNVDPATGEILDTPTIAREKATNNIVSDLGTPGITTTDVIDRHMQRTGVTPEQATSDVWNTARDNGFDIQNKVPVRRTNDTPLQSVSEGAATSPEQLQALKEATDQLKVNKSKGLTGTKHAVTIQENEFRKRDLYVGDDGKLHVQVSQKGPDGKWADIRESAAPIKSPGSQKATLELMSDSGMQKAVSQASNDGLTRQYIWAEDPGGFSAGLKTEGRYDPVTPKAKQFDPNKHTVSDGFVRDKNTGEVLGNYVSVGPNGIQVQIGRQFVTLDIDPSKIKETSSKASLGRSKGGNNSFNQAERTIEAVTDDPQTRQKLRDLIVYPAREAEARLKVEQNALGKGVQSWRKTLNATVSAVKRRAMNRDAVYALEPPDDLVRKEGLQAAKDNMYGAFRDAYGDKATATLQAYDKWMRGAYDNLLERLNAVRRASGQPEIARRENYITHIQELRNNPIAELYQNASESVLGEVEGNKTRGKLPSQIAGRSETFKPVTKYNPFAKSRTGDLKPQDPFSPIMAYGKIALHNIHLTKPASIVRSVDQALRAAAEYSSDVNRVTNPSESATALASKYAGQYADFNTWLNEHANILAGKSSGGFLGNRQLADSEGGRRLLKGIQSLQRVSGRANILGNMSSVMSQGLGLPNAVGTNGIQASLKGFARSFGDITDKNAPWRKSDFLTERYTDGTLLNNKTLGDKVLKPLGVPMQAVERAMVQLIWNGSYERALDRKLTGNQAIRAADSATSKLVSGRSIGDTPHVYNSAVGGAGLQFTRETTESWKNFMSDQSAWGKALTLGAIFLANQGFKAASGRSPLADPVQAVKDTVTDAKTNNEDTSTKDKITRAGQRTANTVTKAVPLLSAAANNLLSQDQRKGLFGSDSEFGRYDSGISAASGLTSVGKSIADATNSKYKSAAQDLLGVVPAGAQIRKTWQGADVINKGYTENAQGNVQTGAQDLSNADKAKALIFGRNAIGGQQDYYNDKSKPLSDQQTARFKELQKSDPAAAQAYLDQVNENRNIDPNLKLSKKQQTELDGSTNKAVADGIKSLLNDSKYKSLSPEDQKKSLDRLTSDISAVEKNKFLAKNQLGQYAPDFDGKTKKLSSNQKKIANGTIDTGKYNKPASSSGGGTSTELSDRLTNDSRSILEQYDDMDENERKKWINSRNNAEFVYEQAKYENDRLNGTLSTAQDIRARDSLSKARIGAAYNKDIRDIYTLSKTDIENYLQSTGNDPEVIKQLQEYDKALNSSGVNKYLKFKNGIAEDGTVAGSNSAKGSAAGKKAKKGKKPKVVSIKTPKLQSIKKVTFGAKSKAPKPPKMRVAKIKAPKKSKVVNSKTS